jgi:tetratricopeptide (TPR) repeat protein
METRSVKAGVFVGLFLAGFATATAAQVAPAGNAMGEKPPSAGRSLLREKKYAEALQALDGEILKSPEDPDLHAAKLEAMLATGLYAETAKLALGLAAKFPDHPEFRLDLGEAAFGMGMVAQAAKTWAALAKDKALGSRAVARAVRAYCAVGKEEEARKLLSDALAGTENPPPSLLRLQMAFCRTGTEGTQIAEALEKAAPEHKAEYEALRKLLAQAGDGPWMGESPAPAGAVSVPLKEKSERVEFSSLVWGSSGSDEISTGTRVLLPATFKDGKERWMLLDSGASVAMISRFLAKDLGLEAVSTAEYIGLGERGKQTSSWVLIPEMRVGDLVFKNVPAILIEDKTDFWEKTGGILPVEFFRHYALQYDRRHSKLTFHPSGTTPEAAMGAGTFGVNSLWFDGNPYIETVLQGQKGAYFLLDTGASTTFLDSRRTGKLGIKMNQTRYAPQTGVGMSGSFQSGVAVDVVLLFGNTRFDFPTIHALPLGWDSDLPCYGIMGRSILDKFSIFFDYTKNVLAFKPY